MYAINLNSGELKHYGVLGMKWGISRGNASRAFRKATKKARRLDRKANKYAKKHLKYSKKAMKLNKRAKNDDDLAKAKAYSEKATKFNYKSSKLRLKGQKWVKSMEKAFSTVRPSDISPRNLARGKEYAYMLSKLPPRDYTVTI